MSEEVFRAEGGRQVAGPDLPTQKPQRRSGIVAAVVAVAFLAGLSSGVMGYSVFYPDSSQELEAAEARAAGYRNRLDEVATVIGIQEGEIELLERRVADVRADPDHPFVYIREHLQDGCSVFIASAVAPKADEAALLSGMRTVMADLATQGQTSIRADRGHSGGNVWGIVYSEKCL